MSKPDYTVALLRKNGISFALNQALRRDTRLACAAGEVSDSSLARSRATIDANAEAPAFGDCLVNSLYAAYERAL